jgi:hypothetical protein
VDGHHATEQQRCAVIPDLLAVTSLMASLFRSHKSRQRTRLAQYKRGYRCHISVKRRSNQASLRVDVTSE